MPVLAPDHNDAWLIGTSAADYFGLRLLAVGQTYQNSDSEGRGHGRTRGDLASCTRHRRVLRITLAPRPVVSASRDGEARPVVAASGSEDNLSRPSG